MQCTDRSLFGALVVLLPCRPRERYAEPAFGKSAKGWKDQMIIGHFGLTSPLESVGPSCCSWLRLFLNCGKPFGRIGRIHNNRGGVDMARINTKGVVIGGLLAGLIINISESILNIPVLGAPMEAAMNARNLPPIGGSAIGVFIVGGFLLGVILVWLYAAVRPRLGPGPKTAIVSAVVVWFLANFWPTLGMGLMGFFPTKLLAISVVWGLGELILAALAGGWLYKEA